MKTVFYIFTAVLLLQSSRALSQNEVGPQSFGGLFTIHYSEDDTRNYYAVDLSHFTDEVSKKSFIRKVCQDSHMAALDSPDASGIWRLTAHTVFAKEAILKKLTDYRNELLIGGETTSHATLSVHHD